MVVAENPETNGKQNLDFVVSEAQNQHLGQVLSHLILRPQVHTGQHF
jgi:hypothetical protein